MSKTANNSNEVQTTWLRVYQICGVIAAFDSVFVLSQPLGSLLQSAIGIFALSLGVTLLIVGAYLYVVDYALFKFLPLTLKGIFAKDAAKLQGTQRQNLNRLHYGTLLFCVIMTGVTCALTLYLREPAAEIVTEKPVIIETDKIAASANKDVAANAAAFDSDIKQLQNERNEAISKAGTQNRELNKLAAASNGWAIGKINAAKNSVKASFDAKIAKIRENKATTLLTATNTANSLVATTAKENEFKMGLFSRQTKAMANLLMFFALAATAFQWFAAIMLAFYAATYNVGNDGATLLGATTIVNTSSDTRTPVYTNPFTQGTGTRTDGGKYLYIQGYVQVSKTGYWYEPVQFINLLRNTYKRKSATRDERLTALQKDLGNYLLTEGQPSQKILDFIRSYPEIAGVEADMSARLNFSKLSSKTQKIALHESAHFIAYCAMNYEHETSIKAVELFCDETAKTDKKGNGKGRLVTQRSEVKCKNMTDEFLTAYICMKLAGLAAEFVIFNNTNLENFLAENIAYYQEGQDIANAFEAIEWGGELGIETKEIEEYFFDAVELISEHLPKIYAVAAELADNKLLKQDRLEFYENKFFPVAA